jgi:hypothetical protein
MDPSLNCFLQRIIPRSPICESNLNFYPSLWDNFWARQGVGPIGSGAAASRAVSSSARLLRGFGIFSHRGVGASPSPSNDG